jgi:S-adenosylmethionine:tRNA ribosyltransferase-isomerase
MDIDAYDYELPRELIAQQPLRRRSDARLLIVRRSDESLAHRHVRDLPEILNPGDCLVLNDTRVVAARLVGYRLATRGRWSGLFLEADAAGLWKVLCKTRGRLAPGEVIVLRDCASRDAARLTLLSKLSEGMWAARPDSDEPAFRLLDRVGRVPLPPYIRNGEMVAADCDNYQTVFAERPGAVAAPTAGLHFTEELLHRLESRGVRLVRITLHVGIGTFRPISVRRLEDHKMHAEWACLTADAANHLQSIRAHGGRIVAVGTTVVRTLETAATGGLLRPWEGFTDLFIRPPYPFRAVDALLTNFHLPKSTLLVLVRTFGGEALIRRAYAEAIGQRYRFFSYGDAMLVL